ncbi:MAG: hypothetical protein ABFD86_22190 [Bryobacteraceae bacterium]
MDIGFAKPVMHADIQIGLPEFVKTAAWPDELEASRLPSTAFADASRKFPIHTKAAAFCSALVAAADGCGDDIGNKISAACVAHGIGEEVLRYTGLFDSVKVASNAPAATYALSIELNGQLQNFLPISSQDDVEDSIAELEKSAADGRLPCELIKQAAEKIADAAEAFDVPYATTSVVSRLGQRCLADPIKAAHLVETRAGIAGDTMGAYREIIGFLNTPGMEQQVIDGLRDLDSANGVDYGFKSAACTKHLTPWEIVFCGPSEDAVEKMAGTHVLLADLPSPVEALRAVSEKEVGRRFVKEASDKIAKARTAAPAEASQLLAELTETQQIDLLDLIVAD